MDPLEILYVDDHYVAVHKPEGMLVHRTEMDRSETRFCLQLLRDQMGQRVYPCHRLDKPTSGVLLFARNKEALQLAFQLFEERKVRKTYTALVRGWLEDQGRVDHSLWRISADGHVSRKGIPQTAVTGWKGQCRYEIHAPVGRYASGRYSLVDLIPETGRIHQLRRHMKHLNHHIIGDTRYGDGVHNRFFRQHFYCHRLMLVARKLQFKHPISGVELCLERARDPAFDVVVDRLQSFLA